MIDLTRQRRLRTLPGQGPDPDGPLVERARLGDRDAFGELVRRHQQGALRLAAGLCGSIDEGHDAVQDGFVKAYGALGGFRADAAFRPWVMTIVANEARNRRRAAARRAGLVVRSADRSIAGAGDPDDVDDPERAAIAAAEFAWVVRALERLSENDRVVIACRYLGELTESEAAVVLGCRPGTVKSRTSRAMARLRDELDMEASR